MIGWKEAIFEQKGEGEYPVNAEEQLVGKKDQAYWEPAELDFLSWNKTIKLEGGADYCYWLCMDMDGKWVLYRSKKK